MMKRWLKTIFWEEKEQNSTEWTNLTQISKTLIVNGSEVVEAGGVKEESHNKLIVRNEEIVIVSMVLFLWGSIILLFINKWGKIRMLEPNLPHFKLSTLASSEDLPSRVSISIDPPSFSRRQSSNQAQTSSLADGTRRLSELSFSSGHNLGRRKSEIIPSRINRKLLMCHQNSHPVFSNRRRSDIGWSRIDSIDDFPPMSEEMEKNEGGSTDSLSVKTIKTPIGNIPCSQSNDTINETNDIFCMNDHRDSFCETCQPIAGPSKRDSKGNLKARMYKRRQSEHPLSSINKYNRRQSEICTQFVNKLQRRESETHLKLFPAPRVLSDFSPTCSPHMFSSTMYLNRMNQNVKFGRARQNSAYPGSCSFPGQMPDTSNKRTKSVDNLRLYPRGVRTTNV